jgi:predicted amidophosphoribosyltransferase
VAAVAGVRARGQGDGVTLAAALAHLFPVPCVGCGVEGRSLCPGCAPALAARPAAGAVAGLGPVVSGLRYEGVARAALLAFKEEGATALAAHLVPPLAAAVVAALASAPGAMVAAVPSTRRARRRRGYEPVRVLAGRAGIRLSPLFAPAGAHVVQKGLGVDERARNLAGVFALARRVAGLRVVLLDDVLTTGATLTAAATTLRAGGAEVLGAAVLADTPRRFGHSSTTLSFKP